VAPLWQGLSSRCPTPGPRKAPDVQTQPGGSCLLARLGRPAWSDL